MQIRNRQEFGFACRKPVLGAPPLASGTVPITTTIIRDTFVRTFLTLFNMTAEFSGPANLNRGHNAPLVQAHMTGIGSAPRLSMEPKNIGYLQLWS